MLAEYNRDILAEAWRGEVSIRQLRVCLTHLPDSSPFKRVITNNGGWSDPEYLLWNIDTELKYLRYEFAVANSDEKHRAKIKRPETLPYPGMVEPEEMPTFTAQNAHDLISAQIMR